MKGFDAFNNTNTAFAAKKTLAKRECRKERNDSCCGKPKAANVLLCALA